MSKIESPDASLRSRVVKAGSWALLGLGFNQLFRLFSNLIMTRILMPEMFGIMALTQSFLYVMALISDIGIGPNIIRSKRGDDPTFMNTAWSIQIARGAIIGLGVALISLIVTLLGDAGYLNEETTIGNKQLPAVISFMALSIFIGEFKSTNIVLANRKLLLGRLTFMEIASQVIGFLVMFVWASYEKSIWALAAGGFTSSVCIVIFSHTIFPGVKNRIAWNSSVFWEIFHFGKWLFLSSIITAFYVQGDRLFLGANITAERMGVYGIAVFILSSLQATLNKVNSMVFFPALTEINRSGKNEILNAYYSIRRNTDLIYITIAGGLFISAENIIIILYDARYIEAGWMLKILSLALIFTAPNVTSAMMLAIGRSKFEANIKLVQLIVLAITLPLLFYYYDLRGAVYSIVVVAICSSIFDFIYRKKHNLLKIKNEFRMLPMFVLGAILGLIFNQTVNLF